MRTLLWMCAVALVMTLAGLGCARTKKSEPVFQALSGTAAHSTTTAAPTTPAAEPATIVTLAEGLSGKVSTANNDLKFVVLTFPVGQMARVNQHLNIYRAGLKVGEVNVTGPQREDSIVADITAGEAKASDEVRDK